MVFKLYKIKVGDNVVETNEHHWNKVSWLIGSKSLILGLQFAINGEPTNTTERHQFASIRLDQYLWLVMSSGFCCNCVII